MKKRIACAFVITLLFLSLAQLSRVIAQQDGKPSNPNAEAAKATSNATPAPVKASPAEKTAESKTDDVKAPKITRPDDKIILGTGVVSVTVSVTDPYGRFVTGLGKDHFDVFDDKVKQQIAHFTDEDSPVSLGIVYDVSGSMKERIVRSVKALRRFIETSHDDDDFFLIGFNDRAKLVQDFTPSGDQVLGHLMFVQPRGSTALYDAAYLAVEKVQQGRHSKKALLIISDGQDNNSRYTYKELRNRVKEADVQIYAIGITDPATDSLAGFGRGVLEEITRMTGGRVFFPNAYNEPELIEICTRIALELRHQYSIGFYPTDLTSEAKWHKVQVKVNPPRGLGRLSLTYREGYQSFKK
jgi:Ca-activated chloride channel family protein